MMRFLIKLFLLAFFALAALPAFVSDDVRLETRPVAQLENGDAAYADEASVVSFAAGFADDMSGICARQPGLCEEGARLVEGLINRAGHGLKVALAMIEQRRDAERAKADEAATSL